QRRLPAPLPRVHAEYACARLNPHPHGGRRSGISHARRRSLLKNVCSWRYSSAAVGIQSRATPTVRQPPSLSFSFLTNSEASSNLFDILTVVHRFEICHTIRMARKRHVRTKQQGQPAPVSFPDSAERARDQGLSIGFAIRARRRKLGLTLRELAAGSGLSAPFISQAERGLTTPSVISLLHLARAMKVEIGHFIDVPKGGRTIRRANDPEYIELGPKVRHILLSGSLDDPKMETLIILLEPGVAHPTVRREGEGFYYLLEGKVNF